MTLAAPVRDRAGRLRGVLATSLLLDDLSEPLLTVIAAQARQHQQPAISIVDAQGHLIATPQSERILQPVAETAAGRGRGAGRPHGDTPGRRCAGPAVALQRGAVPGVGWAVVVQRPTAEVLAAVTNFRRLDRRRRRASSPWAACSSGSSCCAASCGPCMPWPRATRRSPRPAAPPRLRRRPSPAAPTRSAAWRARSSRLEHDVIAQLGELHTLLDTSNAVVSSLDPRAVGGTIIREVQAAGRRAGRRRAGARRGGRAARAGQRRPRRALRAGGAHPARRPDVPRGARAARRPRGADRSPATGRRSRRSLTPKASAPCWRSRSSAGMPAAWCCWCIARSRSGSPRTRSTCC